MKNDIYSTSLEIIDEKSLNAEENINEIESEESFEENEVVEEDENEDTEGDAFQEADGLMELSVPYEAYAQEGRVTVEHDVIQERQNNNPGTQINGNNNEFNIGDGVKIVTNNHQVTLIVSEGAAAQTVTVVRGHTGSAQADVFTFTITGESGDRFTFNLGSINDFAQFFANSLDNKLSGDDGGNDDNGDGNDDDGNGNNDDGNDDNDDDNDDDGSDNDGNGNNDDDNNDDGSSVNNGNDNDGNGNDDTPNSEINDIDNTPAVPVTPDIHEIPDTLADIADLTTIDELDVPLASFDELVSIDDLDVPLAASTFEEDELETVIIGETPVPLSAMPQTGLADMSSALATGLLLSAMAAAVTSRAIRKLIKEEA